MRENARGSSGSGTLYNINPSGLARDKDIVYSKTRNDDNNIKLSLNVGCVPSELNWIGVHWVGLLGWHL